MVSLRSHFFPWLHVLGLVPYTPHCKLCLTALDLLSQPWEQGASTHVDWTGVWQNHQCRWYCNPIQQLSLQEQDGPSQTSLALAILETWLHTSISCTCNNKCALMYSNSKFISDYITHIWSDFHMVKSQLSAKD
jgi:hypothetical protein